MCEASEASFAGNWNLQKNTDMMEEGKATDRTKIEEVLRVISFETHVRETWLSTCLLGWLYAVLD